MPRPRPILIIGGGGHALAVAEAAGLAGVAVRGFLDDAVDAPLGAGRPSAVRLGGLDDLEHVMEEEGGVGWVLALGGVGLRACVLARLRGTGAGPLAATIVHPAAFVSPSAVIGRGVFIGPGAIVHARAAVGDHAIINSGAIVEHECAVGENTHIAPAAALAGRVVVGAGTLVGLGARVLPGIRVGDGCTVGAGAVVTRDVADGVTVRGVPARPAEP